MKKVLSCTSLLFLAFALLQACTDSTGTSPATPPPNPTDVSKFGKSVTPLPTEDQLATALAVGKELYLTADTSISFSDYTTRYPEGVTNPYDLRFIQVARLMRDGGCDFYSESMDLEKTDIQSNDKCPVHFQLLRVPTTADNQDYHLAITMLLDTTDATMLQNLDVTHIELQGEFFRNYTDLDPADPDAITAIYNKSTEHTKKVITTQFHSQKYGEGQSGTVNSALLKNHDYGTTVVKMTNGNFFKLKDFSLEVWVETTGDAQGNELKKYYVNGNQVSKENFYEYQELFFYFELE